MSTFRRVLRLRKVVEYRRDFLRVGCHRPLAIVAASGRTQPLTPLSLIGRNREKQTLRVVLFQNLLASARFNHESSRSSDIV
jgi:hypothetical protein